MAADNGSEMECPSPDIGDSRKRPLDSDVDNSLTKRSHFSSGQCAIYSIFFSMASVCAYMSEKKLILNAHSRYLQYYLTLINVLLSMKDINERLILPFVAFKNS